MIPHVYADIQEEKLKNVVNLFWNYVIYIVMTTWLRMATT